MIEQTKLGQAGLNPFEFRAFSFSLEIVCHACGSLWHAYGNARKNCCANCGSRDVHEHTVPTDDGHDKPGADSQGPDRTGRDTKGDS